MQHSKLLAGELKSELTVTMCINWLLIADYHALSKCGVSRPQNRILGISVGYMYSRILMKSSLLFFAKAWTISGQ